MAIAAMIRMMATTISSSISEKPFCCFRISLFPLVFEFDFMLVMVMILCPVGIDIGTCKTKPLVTSVRV
jgi:hypothetical protein